MCSFRSSWGHFYVDVSCNTSSLGLRTGLRGPDVARHCGSSQIERHNLEGSYFCVPQQLCALGETCTRSSYPETCVVAAHSSVQSLAPCVTSSRDGHTTLFSSASLCPVGRKTRALQCVQPRHKQACPGSKPASSLNTSLGRKTGKLSHSTPSNAEKRTRSTLVFSPNTCLSQQNVAHDAVVEQSKKEDQDRAGYGGKCRPLTCTHDPKSQSLCGPEDDLRMFSSLISLCVIPLS